MDNLMEYFARIRYVKKIPFFLEFPVYTVEEL
jgi:hypothetical protein